MKFFENFKFNNLFSKKKIDENKGFIEILNLEITKRERWKVKLLRK